MGDPAALAAVLAAGARPAALDGHRGGRPAGVFSDHRLSGGPAAAHGGHRRPGPGPKPAVRRDGGRHFGPAGRGGDRLLRLRDHPAGRSGGDRRPDHRHRRPEPAAGGADGGGPGRPGGGGRVPDPDPPGQSAGFRPGLGPGPHHEGARHDGRHGGGGVLQ